MATIQYKGELPKGTDQLKQGDIVYCRAVDGAHDIWGVYSSSIKAVISFDGGGEFAVRGYPLYVGDVVNYWTIVKRIPCNKAKIIIEEIE